MKYRQDESLTPQAALPLVNADMIVVSANSRKPGHINRVKAKEDIGVLDNIRNLR